MKRKKSKGGVLKTSLRYRDRPGGGKAGGKVKRRRALEKVKLV